MSSPRDQDEKTPPPPAEPNLPSQPQPQPPPPFPSSQTSIHNLLLLSDSALPLGSFAFSSGLESYLAHHRSPTVNPRSSAATTTTAAAITHFLPLSLTSLGTTSLPFVLAAHRSPSSIATLDDTYDATLSCTVARRASVATGKALVGVWERAFRPQQQQEEVLFAGEEGLVGPHLAPLWGLVTRLMGLGEDQAAYVFLLNHVKAVLSAAVRVGVLGPYQAQGLLVSDWLRGEIERVLRACWDLDVDDAGQVVPVLDLWVGRHELLYSRIFNS